MSCGFAARPAGAREPLGAWWGATPGAQVPGSGAGPCAFSHARPRSLLGSLPSIYPCRKALSAASRRRTKRSPTGSKSGGRAWPSKCLGTHPFRLACRPSRMGPLVRERPRARVGWPCTSQPPPWRVRLAEHRGRSRQRAQVPARHRRPCGCGTNAFAPVTCAIGGVSHPSAFPVHNDPDVNVHFRIGNGPCPRAVKSRLRRGGSNATPNGRRSFLRGGPIGAVPSSRRSAGGRLGSRPSPRPPRRPCRGWHSRCA